MLFGYDKRTEVFQKLIDGKKLSQSYLFYGDKGIGKNAFANLLAYALESGKFEKTDEPLLDAFFVSRDLETSSLGIEKVSEIKRFLWQKPVKSLHRLVVVDDSEDLTPEAQGALLKIVEEPPAHALLIFIAHDSGVFLPPLLSRLSKVYFPRMSKEEIAGILLGKFKVSKEKAREIAGRSFGRLGRALLLLDGKEASTEEDLASDLENKILKLRENSLKKNAGVLAWLLDRETLIKRYNLNMNLQRKAMNEILNNK